jgi:tRNA dimethylallyltransferase
LSSKIFIEEQFFCTLTPTTFEKKDPLKAKKAKKKVILLAGPTGSGKTQLSINLSQCLGNCEIISADSMQVYKGMDIGTAKISVEEQCSIPHHLIDIKDVTDPMNVVDFYYAARECIKDILSRGNCPLVVGGSGFYFRALLYGPPNGPPSVPFVREKLEEELESKGVDFLFTKLQKLDPTYASSITSGDKHKIVRALEIITLTKEPVSILSWKTRPKPDDLDYRCWFVHRSRDNLYKRIDKRCEKMIEKGLIEEVENLKEALALNPSASQAIGYKQTLDYLKTNKTEKDFKHFVETFKTASRHYAKKQFTWFRNEAMFKWLNIELHDFETAAEIIAQDYKLL